MTEKMTQKQFALNRFYRLLSYLGIDKETFLKENGIESIEQQTELDFAETMCLVSDRLDIDTDYFFDRFRLEKGEAKWTFKMSDGKDSTK